MRYLVPRMAVGVLLLAAAAAAAEGAPALPPCPTAEEKPEVAALVKRTDQLLKGRSSIGTMTMSIKSPAWSRKVKLKVWARGNDEALVRVVEGGARETGMMTLKRDKQLWNYLPQAGRVMKLPSAMLGDSWLGSDFNNDDLVKGSSLTDDFDAVVTGTRKEGDQDAWIIQLKPKPSAVVVWSRIDLALSRQSCLPVSEQFFDEDGKRARSLTFGDFRQVGWRQFPMTMTVEPAEAGHSTSITYEDLQFDVDVPDDTFSLLRLRQGG